MKPKIDVRDLEGAQDLVVTHNGLLSVFQNLAPDQELLATTSDGMNAHDRPIPGSCPTSARGTAI